MFTVCSLYLKRYFCHSKIKIGSVCEEIFGNLRLITIFTILHFHREDSGQNLNVIYSKWKERTDVSYLHRIFAMLPVFQLFVNWLHISKQNKSFVWCIGLFPLRLESLCRASVIDMFHPGKQKYWLFCGSVWLPRREFNQIWEKRTIYAFSEQYVQEIRWKIFHLWNAGHSVILIRAQLCMTRSWCWYDNFSEFPSATLIWK